VALRADRWRVDHFETPVGTKVMVALAAAALAIAGTVFRDFGPAQSSSDVIIVTPADSSGEPAPLVPVDELVPGQGVQIAPLEFDLD